MVIKCPSNTASLYFNYKGTFLLVLLTLVDVNYKFIYVDIDAFGRNSDGGIFSNAILAKAPSANKLKLPDDTPIAGAEHLGPMPYVMVSDEAFPLHTHLMRPFPRRGCPVEQQAFNYCLSRAR